MKLEFAAHPTRRLMMLGAPLMAFSVGRAEAAPLRNITIYKTPYCGCCKGWVTHMTRAGFKTSVVEVEDLTPVRKKHGIPPALSSCHTGLIGGYVVEGHVPPADVIRLLDLKPKALGILVPGMPMGSPGMEMPTGETEPYNTLLLLDRKGRTEIFRKHA